MDYSILKIKNIPFRITDEDEVLMDNLTYEEIPWALNELGFGKRKEKTLEDGTRVYYKSRKNGVYIAYKRNTIMNITNKINEENKQTKGEN